MLGDLILYVGVGEVIILKECIEHFEACVPEKECMVILNVLY